MNKYLLAAAMTAALPAAIVAQDSLLQPGTQPTKAVSVADTGGKKIPNTWICVLKPGAASANPAAQAARSANVGGGRVTHVFDGAFEGFTLNIPDRAIAKVQANNPNISYCEQDQVMAIASEGKASIAAVSAQADTLPWGVSRVGGGSGSGFQRAWVIDSGIASHPDLNIDTGRSRSFVSGLGYTDTNGHGTHVAGTIAARANGSGVVGVAPGAPVVSLRVFDGSGSGSNSAVLSAVNHVYSYASPGDVVNMSLGGGISSTLDNAVLRASNRGIYFTLATGNESQNANNVSPARVNGSYIWTVSAFDINDRFASFSNFANPPIDVSEPGVQIVSTYLNGSYATLSGTSMATPHLAGLILQRSVRNGGRVTGDRDNNPDIIGVK